MITITHVVPASHVRSCLGNQDKTDVIAFCDYDHMAAVCQQVCDKSKKKLGCMDTCPYKNSIGKDMVPGLTNDCELLGGDLCYFT
jgi:hypothetical protein